MRDTLRKVRNDARIAACTAKRSKYRHAPHQSCSARSVATLRILRIVGNIFLARAETRRQSIFVPRARMAADHMKLRGCSGGAFLEIGDGSGIFCEKNSQLGLFERVIGLEPTPDRAKMCRDKGIEVLEASFEKAEGNVSLEALIAFKVIEHLFDPKDFLQWCFENLATGAPIKATFP